MTLFVSYLSVAQAATLINAIIAFIQFTLSASLVVLLINFMPKTNKALTWTSVSRLLHASIWPTFLRADSDSKKSTGAAVNTISFLAIASIVLVPISGVILPPGLRQGPLLSSPQPVNFTARYVPDTSPIASATTPNRQNFQPGRTCDSVLTPISCPGMDDVNATSYPSSIIDRFNSTTHGPFAIQYRRFFRSSDYQHLSSGLLGTAETLFLRNGTFMVEGIIVDMSVNQPGVGFLNQTLPDLTDGGTWSQDVLWLEPVTSCIDTNLTVDFNLTSGPNLDDFASFNITDHGGFYALTHDFQSVGDVGQALDLHQRAYQGAITSNLLTMSALNATRESSFQGKQYIVPRIVNAIQKLDGTQLGKTIPFPLSYSNFSSDADDACQQIYWSGPVSPSTIQVTCSAYLGPPARTDGGDPQAFDAGSQWSQRIHACASATRASVQTVIFSTNRSTDLTNLSITRQSSGNPVLWAIENPNYRILTIDLLWGQVADRYENDSSIWTTRSETLFLPAGKSGHGDLAELPVGQPSSAHAAVWVQVYNPNPDMMSLVDYSGTSDYAIKAKIQEFLDSDPVLGYAHIQNAIWTDIMANNVIGTPASTTLLVSAYQPSIEYNFKFAIPGFILLLIWLPVFVASLFLLASREVTFSYMRKVLNHTSVGRVVTGTSMLRAKSHGSGEGSSVPEPPVSPYLPLNRESHVDLGEGVSPPGHRRDKSDWADTVGNTPVTLCLEVKDSRRRTTT